MQKIQAHGFETKDSKVKVLTVDVRQPRTTDVTLVVLQSGICHSDVHQARAEWGGEIFPMVPGHEIVGRVTAVGSGVHKFKVGDVVGVGCMVHSCRSCRQCRHDEEQFCKTHKWTYNSKNEDGTINYGGYSQSMVVDEHFVLAIPAALHKNLAGVAPLLCAGITTFSPIFRHNVKPGTRMAVVGLGGLGHMGVKFGRAFGAHVTMISTSLAKKADATKLGAHAFIASTDADAMKAAADSFDFILNTISAKYDQSAYLNLLDVGGVMCIVGAPPASAFSNFSLIGGRKTIVGSLIGGIAETQQMLNFCADHQIYSEIESIKASEIDTAYDRMVKSDVKYRFVIDGATLGK